MSYRSWILIKKVRYEIIVYKKAREQSCAFLIEKHKIVLLLLKYVLSLHLVRGEIRTNKEAFAIISRSAKSVGNLLGIKTQRDNT
jgi:hypothetical protein